MSLFGDLLSPYWFAAKAGILAILVIAVGGYVGWLNHTISRHEDTIRSLNEGLAVCDHDRDTLRSANNELNRTMDVWEAYYNERGCLDLKDDALKPDEMKIRTK